MEGVHDIGGVASCIHSDREAGAGLGELVDGDGGRGGVLSRGESSGGGTLSIISFVGCFL